MEHKHDVVIIGSGLGGLECGLMLAKEGWDVCLLEQDAFFGGCFRSFLRKGRYIDTGIHFVGSMGEGQILRQYFKYFGLMDSLSVVALDNDFDTICFPRGEEYRHVHGYEGFIGTLSEQFPSEREGLVRYCRKIKEIGETISVDVHRSGKLSSGGLGNLGTQAWAFICDCVSDPLLRQVLAGNNPLYGGRKDVSNLYHHAMITHSNIEGCYRFAGGTQKVADAMAGKIASYGGCLHSRQQAIRLVASGDKVDYVETRQGERFRARYYISDLHPAATFNMLEGSTVVKKAYKSRLNALPNTYGLFSVYLIMKPGTVPYLNKNYYLYAQDDVWDTVMGKDLRPKAMMLSMQFKEEGARFSDVATLMSPVDSQLFSPWAGEESGKRSAEYYALKEEIAARMVSAMEARFPGMASRVEHVCSASPLTYHSYTGTPQGTAYGLLKDYSRVLASLIPARTKLENLLLTGQNLNVHGALGVTLTAAATCSELLGTEYLAKKIGRA